MGWFWEKPSPPKSSDTDPLRDLDPSLRDFLSKESPIKYKPAPAPPPSKQTPSSPPPETTTPTNPLVPPESLYQDGRYAHLWTNYKSLASIEAETKSDNEKLQDVLDGYKERKAQIGRAAVENCVEEQMAIGDCYENGSYARRTMMCRPENRAFERCYIMQSRFLKALGYLSTYDRPPEVDENIQMHADTLYHRMLAQEAAIESAKAAGQTEPTFAPILSPDGAPAPAPAISPSLPTTAALESRSITVAKEPTELPTLPPQLQAQLTPTAQKALRERLKGMTNTEREVEERSVQMELDAAGEIGIRVREVEEGRKRRREEGRGTAGDTISGWFGW